MGFADELLQRVFKGNKDDRLILTEGVIQRSSAFMKDYHAWSSEHSADCFSEVRRNLALSKAGIDDDLKTLWLDLSQAKGFKIELDNFMPKEESFFLIESMKNRVLSYPYRLSTSYTKAEKFGKEVHLEEWYYLKPPLAKAGSNGPIDQCFGNIKIELHQRHRTIIKVLVTSYSDRMYLASQPFESFMDYLFGQSHG